MKRIEWLSQAAFRVFPALFLLLALPAFGQKHVDELQQVVLPPPGAVMIVQTGAPPVAAFTCFIYDTNVLYWLQTLPNWGSITNIPLTGLQPGGASVGQVLGFNGTHWAPTAPTSGGGGTNGVEAGTNVVIYFDTNGLPLINAVIGRTEVTNTVLYLIGLSNVYVGTFNGQGYGLVNIPGAAITNAVGTATNWLGLLSPQLYFDKFYGYAAITNGLDMLKGGMSMFSGTSQTFQSGAIWQYIKNAAGGWIWEGNGSGIGDWSRDASQLTNAGAGYVTGTLTNPIASAFGNADTFTQQPYGSVMTFGSNFWCYVQTNGDMAGFTNGVFTITLNGSQIVLNPTNALTTITNLFAWGWGTFIGPLTNTSDYYGANGYFTNNGYLTSLQSIIRGNAVNIGGGTSVSVNGVVVQNVLTNTTGTQKALRLATTVQQGGSAAYTGFSADVTETSVGSGTKHPYSMTVANTEIFWVDDTGTFQAFGGATTQDLDLGTNTFAGTTFLLGTNAFISCSTNILLSALANAPGSTERFGQLTIVATGTVTVTNPPSWRASDFVTSRTLTNGNSMALVLDVQPGCYSNLFLVQLH